ncbi:hypothetical protein RJ55_01143 [Drechmeria coniospora]|nr:hypothetical protein RJ55_01143 [Drechmeria coniospora]
MKLATAISFIAIAAMSVNGIRTRPIRAAPVELEDATMDSATLEALRVSNKIIADAHVSLASFEQAFLEVAEPMYHRVLKKDLLKQRFTNAREKGKAAVRAASRLRLANTHVEDAEDFADTLKGFEKAGDSVLSALTHAKSAIVTSGACDQTMTSLSALESTIRGIAAILSDFSPEPLQRTVLDSPTPLLKVLGQGHGRIEKACEGSEAIQES